MGAPVKQRTIYMKQTRRNNRLDTFETTTVKAIAGLGEDGRWHVGELSMDEEFMLREDAIIRIGMRLDMERKARIAIIDAELSLKRIDMMAAAGFSDDG